MEIIRIHLMIYFFRVYIIYRYHTEEQALTPNMILVALFYCQKVAICAMVEKYAVSKTLNFKDTSYT